MVTTNMHLDKYFISPPPKKLQQEFDVLFTQNALNFLAALITVFTDRIDQLHWNRLARKSFYQSNPDTLPRFSNPTRSFDKAWKVAPVPSRLQNRRLDIGDVSPSNTDHFFRALNADVQGVQVDFDDGHCPTWRNQIVGLFNVYQVVHGNVPSIPHISKIPILMLRPRAWNMIENNIMINGRKPPGPLVDFALLMFHNANILANSSVGPFFYLSKLEGAKEAKLWNDIFVWSQQKLNILHGTIKACVLIENILSSFEMENILYELKDHSLGLNCGIWDYSASIICKFGDNPKFLLPDRNKYVDIHKHYLKKYIELVIQTCHKHGAHATGGMAALLINSENKSEIIQKVIDAKKVEILDGADGFMVYDLQLVPHINMLWNQLCPTNVNQIHVVSNENIVESDLLKIPHGGVTYEGLKHNIEVSILFIFNWLEGQGHFYYKNAVEDSATAEISRSQIWQWIRHQATTEDNQLVCKQLIQHLTRAFVERQKPSPKLNIAAEIFLEISTMRYFPDFITSYLNDHYIFQNVQNEIFTSKL